jgi:hypothetical protein
VAAADNRPTASPPGTGSAETGAAGDDPNQENKLRTDEDGNYRNDRDQIVVRYEYENDRRVRNRNNRLVPGLLQQFGDRHDLIPGEEYEVFDKKGGLRGEFVIDEEARVARVKTYPGEAGRWNPELTSPRRDAEYQVEVHGHRGHFYNYETDEIGETVRAYGELRAHPSSDGHRHNVQQTGEGQKGRDYYAQEPLKDVFSQIPWNGGHFFGTSFGGSGQTLNLFPQLEWINQNPDAQEWRRNFYAMEGEWRHHVGDGRKVEVDMRVVPSRDGGPPEGLVARHWIDGNPQEAVYFPNRPPLREDWILENLERAIEESPDDIHSDLMGDNDT